MNRLRDDVASKEGRWMRVLVTGANGFVGVATCMRLLSAGAFVRGAVRNADRTLAPGTESIVVGEIGPETDWSRALEGIDCTVHLAARVHQMRDRSSDALSAYESINVEGSIHLARSAARSGVKRLVFLSTIKVLGESRPAPFSHHDSPAPVDPYSASKWRAEESLMRLGRDAGLEVVVIRPPLVYGPGVKANFLRLMKLVRMGIPLPFAGVDNRRSLLYVGNLADAILSAMTHQSAPGNTYLVSDGEDVSTPVLVRRIGAALGTRSRLVNVPPALMRAGARLLGRSDAAERLLGSLCIDSSAICRELGWKPPFTMERGLSDTASWYLRRESEA